MKIRSMLFVPGDSRDRAVAGEGVALADALILDLEDSVSPDQKQAARDCTRQMLQARGRQYLFVRINAFDTGLSLDDLAAVMPMRPDIEDLDGLREETLAARRDGFTAKAVIHPKHVAIVNQALSPNPTDIAWAQRVVAAFEADPGAGVVKMDGRMVDKPHLLKDRRILELAAT